MNNNDLISGSELRKMIEKQIQECDIIMKEEYGYPGEKDALVKKDALEELLSELDNLSGVSGWIPVTEDMERKTYLLWAKEGFYFIGHYDGASNNYCRDGNDGELVIATHYMPLPPHP